MGRRNKKGGGGRRGGMLEKTTKFKDWLAYRAGDRVMLPSLSTRGKFSNKRAAVVEQIYPFFLVCMTENGYRECFNLYDILKMT